MSAEYIQRAQWVSLGNHTMDCSFLFTEDRRRRIKIARWMIGEDIVEAQFWRAMYFQVVRDYQRLAEAKRKQEIDSEA